MPSRRDAVRRLGAALGLAGLSGFAGCLGSGGPGSTATDDDTGPAGATGTTTAASTTGRRRTVQFDDCDPSSLSAGTTRVFTPSLAQVLVDAEAADPPADATVREVADLPPDRREVVRDAVGRAAQVEPQTRLGEFVRNEFVGGYWRLDGTVYRGREVQQTDVAFFSERAWYVLSAMPVDREAPTLSVQPVPEAVLDALDRPLSEHRPQAVTYRDADPDGAVAQFVRGTERMLVHDALLEVTLVS